MADPRIARVSTALAQVGETVVVRRLTGANPQIPLDCSVKAVVRGYAPQELVGGITQNDKKVTISHAEMSLAQWPWPLKKDDRVLIDGKAAVVQSVELRKIGDDVAMCVAQVRG